MKRNLLLLFFCIPLYAMKENTPKSKIIYRGFCFNPFKKAPEIKAPQDKSLQQYIKELVAQNPDLTAQNYCIIITSPHALNDAASPDLPEVIIVPISKL
ncbi:MAG: hypothetical protein P4L31_08210 [Candidatus Babeliales bacterium]|nr:hypothetical protein [Candidatus Babeliales bacterium]